MLSVIEEQVARSELAEKFLQDAIVADLEMQASSKGYLAEDVHAYVAAKVAGKKALRPKLKRMLSRQVRYVVTN